MAKKPESKNLSVDETTGETTYAVATTGAGTTEVQMFQSGDFPEQLREQFEQLSLPPIVKPRLVPDGAFFVAEITGIMDSPIKEYKNRILQLKREPDGFKFCFPLTAVVSKALGSTDKEQNEKIGRVLMIRKTGTKASKKGKKAMNMFEVYLKKQGKK